MKSKMKRLSKSTLSVILAVIMVLSTVVVGIVTSNAAFTDLAATGEETAKGQSGATSIIGTLSSTAWDVDQAKTYWALDAMDTNHYKHTFIIPKPSSNTQFKLLNNSSGKQYSVKDDSGWWFNSSTTYAEKYTCTDSKNMQIQYSSTSTDTYVGVTFEFFYTYGNDSKVIVEQTNYSGAPVVAGFGESSWSNQEKTMTYSSSTNSWSRTFPNISAGTYTFRVLPYNTWDTTYNYTQANGTHSLANGTVSNNNDSDNNFKLVTTAKTDVTVTLDSKGKVNVTTVVNDTATYTVTSSAGSNGSVTPASATAGDVTTAEFTATPNSGYEFSGWTLSDGVTPATGYTTSSNPIKVNATAAGTVTASFSKSNWPPVDLTGYASSNITNRIIYANSSSSNDITNNNLLDTQYVKANSAQTSIWVDFTSLLPLTKDEHFYFGLSNSTSYTGFYCSNSSTVSVTEANAPDLAGGELTNKDSSNYFACVYGNESKPIANVKHLGCLITKGSNNKFTFTMYTGDSYDPFYIGGRFTITSGGTDIHTGAEDWNFLMDSTTIKWTDDGSNLWSLNTGRTISQLSPLKYEGYNDSPQYFIVHDKVDHYAIAAADASGEYFKNYNSSSNYMTLSPVANPTDVNELMFDDYDNTSDGIVILHLDASDYDPGNSASTLKIWYTLQGETTAVASKLSFVASPPSVTVGKTINLAAVISDVNTTYVDNPTTDLQFKFEKSSDGSAWTTVATKTGSDITALSNGRYRAQITESYDSVTSYQYRVTVSTTGSYSGETLREVSKTATGSWKAPTVYYTSDITTSAASPSWTEITGSPKTATISTTLASGSSYTIALSDEAGYNPDFADFEIDADLTKYCDITMGSKTVTIDNEDHVVRTYVITPRTNCSNPTITIDADNGKIYAVATFDKYGDSEKTLSNTTETVKYYFAKPADKDFTGTNNLDGTKGLNIKYYNNSVTTKTATKWAVPVKVDGTTSTGSYSATSVQYTGGNSDEEDYQIKVDKSQLFRNTTENSAYSSTANDWVTCNVYVLEMPIWATSANLCNSGGTTQLGSPILALNPNRIYVFWSTNDSDKQWSGVPLDTSFWVSEQSNGAHKRGDTGYERNQVPTKNFKTNLINYNTSADWSETMNNALSDVYSSRSISRPLYWGMFANGNPSGLTNWDIALNLAQRKNDQSYYASVWESVNPVLTKDPDGDNNPLKGGLLTAYDSDELMPFFDYDYLSGTQDVGTAYTNKDFPFYSSTFDNVTTYSYDSMVDLNRHYDVSDGNYEVEAQTVKLGANLGYAPFHGESVTDTAAGFANEYDINFYMTTTGKIQGTNENHDICFNFSGDDDVWVFVDGVLVLDLGGAHKISAGSINFSDMKVYYKTAANDFTSGMGTSNDWATDSDYVYTMDLDALFKAYGVDFTNTDATTQHTLQMFYTERGRLESNMSLSFNLPQASGLNVRNTVRATNVNAGLKDAALAASNPDYFTYSVANMAADDSAINTLKAKDGIYANALLPSSTSQWSANNTIPVFPYKTDVNRVFGGTTMILGAAADNRTATGGSALGNLTGSWQYLTNSVYALTDRYAQSTAEDAKLSGITGTNTYGDFHLLGGEMANFTDKVRPNSYVRVVQTQEMGEAAADSSNSDIIKYNAVSDNNAGNYYLTSYRIYDEAAKADVVSETPYDIRFANDGGVGGSDNYYANDESAAENGFYFTNYAGDTNNTNPAMTVDFYNDIAVGDLIVEKKMNDSSTPSDNFYFKVEFAQVFGDDSIDWAEYDVDYKVYDSESGLPVSDTVKSYGNVGIIIQPGQYAVISGVPVETRYRITEVTRAGYSLSDIDKTAEKANGSAIAATYVASGFYDFENQSIATAVTGNPSSEGWTSGNMTTLDKSWTDSADYTYYCNMIPVIPETFISGRNYVSTSTITFTNKKELYTIQFKYYDRYQISGQTAGINSSATTYSVSLDSLPKLDKNSDAIIHYVDDDESKGVASIDFSKLIANYATEFASNVLNVSNVMCDYKLWTSQSDAEAAMVSDSMKYFDNGTATSYTAAQAPYHTTYLGKPNTTGEKWVNLYDSKGNEVTVFTHAADYMLVRNIVVWCYNSPKQYDVNVYGADSFDDLTQKTVNGSTVYVADGTKSGPRSTGKKFYYNQRFGTEVANADDLNAAGFISNYGISGVNEYNLCPQDYASASISNGGTTYSFAYWAYDQAGTQLASTDIKYKYRVTTDTNLYAVYVSSAAAADVGISVSANDNDTYVVQGDNEGVSYTRLNILANVYNAADYDPLVKKISFVNITLSTQIRDNPTTYTPAKINEMFNAYKTQLKSLIELHEQASEFAFNEKKAYTHETDSSLNLTLTTRGFIYTVTSNGNTAADGEPTIQLTNKNRGQFTISYKTSTLVKDNSKPTCLVFCGAVKYGDDWKISDNCLIYRNGAVTDNTKTSWN